MGAYEYTALDAAGREKKGVLEGDTGIDGLHSLVRSYFKLDGHHVQFNVVSADTLREAKANPSAHRDLMSQEGCAR